VKFKPTYDDQAMPYHETASFFGFCSTFQRFGQLESVFLFVFRVVQEVIRFI
jgi:hypothetical protein